MVEVLIAAIVGAVVTAVVAWLLPNRDVVRLRKQLADAEGREEGYRRQLGATVIGRIDGVAEPQFVVLTASEDIEAVRLDYCIDTGARAATWPVQPAVSRKEVRIPIDRNCLQQLHRTKYDGRTGSADVRFKVLIRVLGREREVKVPARIEQVYGSEVPSVYLRVVG